MGSSRRNFSLGALFALGWWVAGEGRAGFAAVPVGTQARVPAEHAWAADLQAGPLERRFALSYSHRAHTNRLVFDGREQPSVSLSGSLWDADGRRETWFLDRSRGEAVERRYLRLEEERRHRAYEYDPRQGIGEYFPLTVRAQSSLAGARVAFWPDSERGHPVNSRGESVELLERGDPDLLAGLLVDGPLRAFRIGPERALGERWQIPEGALREALFPGGELGFADDYAEQRQNPDDDRALWEQCLRNLAGDLELEVTGLGSELRGRVARAKVSGAPAAMLRGVPRFEGAREDGRETPELDLSLRVELSGELVWDLDRDRWVRLDLVGRTEFQVAVHSSMERGGRAFRGTITTHLAGELSLNARCDPPEGAPSAPPPARSGEAPGSAQNPKAEGLPAAPVPPGTNVTANLGPEGAPKNPTPTPAPAAPGRLP